MLKVTKGTMLTGDSDDLILLDGELKDELYACGCEKGILTFSDGTLLEIEYDFDGIWRFHVVYKGYLYDKKIEGNSNENKHDKVYFLKGLKWCAFSEDVQVVY